MENKEIKVENYGKIIEEGYKLLHSDKISEAEEKFLEAYNKLKKLKIEKKDDNFNRFISCILGLGEINMKKGEIKKALDFYLEGNILTNSEDFNILFNLGVVYRNLGEEEKCRDFLEKAKIINPKDSNLIRFIGEGANNNIENENIVDNIDNSFKSKIEGMINDLNKK